MYSTQPTRPNPNPTQPNPIESEERVRQSPAKTRAFFWPFRHTPRGRRGRGGRTDLHLSPPRLQEDARTLLSAQHQPNATSHRQTERRTAAPANLNPLVGPL